MTPHKSTTITAEATQKSVERNAGRKRGSNIAKADANSIIIGGKTTQPVRLGMLRLVDDKTLRSSAIENSHEKRVMNDLDEADQTSHEEGGGAFGDEEQRG